MFKWLLPVLAAFALACALPLTPASAQEADVPTSDTGAAPQPAEVATDPAPQPEQPSTATEPAATPEPPPPPADPPPPPESQQPGETPPPPAEQTAEPVPDHGSDASQHDTASHPAPAASEPVTTTFSTAVQGPVAAVPPGASTPTTTDPLGWDVYDDALFAETGNGPGGAGLIGGGPPTIGGPGALRAIGSAVERDKRQDAKPESRAEPKPAGGSGPGGSGPGPGSSLGLFGAAGGTGAGMALLTLLGMASGWFLLAPDRNRAFLASTATWRPSAYVPPIEQPG